MERWSQLSMIGLTADRYGAADESSKGMKDEVLAALITARRLLTASEALCSIRENHACSAGVVVLQDAVELVLLGALIALGVDEERSLESLSFSEMISELRRRKVTVPKSGTVKAMNKQRVLIKHYGQTVDPDTARRYFSASRVCVDGVLQYVLGKTLAELFLHELVTNAEAKECLTLAHRALDETRYFEAMVEIRKALFLEIEGDYSIYGWRDRPSSDPVGLLSDFARGGMKAPYYTRNREWIAAHVREPFDYVQLDHGHIRADLVEWGASTQDFWNIWRLTPPVFRADKESTWQVKRDPTRFAEGAVEANVRYCLDAVIALILKKQDHFDLAKHLSGTTAGNVEVTARSEPTNVYTKATTDSEMVGTVSRGTTMHVFSVVPGLGTDDTFVYVFPSEPTQRTVFGYVSMSDIKRA